MAAFEAAGVTIDALVTAQDRGDISFATYDEPHVPPGRPSGRDYAAFRASLGPPGERLREVFVASGLAEPGPASRLSTDEEAYLARVVRLVEATGQPDLAMRVLRLFAEAARRASEATLDIYAEAVRRVAPDTGRLTIDEEYTRLFAPWSPMARDAPRLAAWLTAHHMSRAIDGYSVDAMERQLVELGYLTERAADPPGIAFVDLTGFTRLSDERGDEAAAGMALRLADLARDVAARHGGRVVKLLGDGVLVWLPGARQALDAAVELLGALVAADLPAGHAGVHAGPVIQRDGDVFGRTVNLAARLADAAPSGEIYTSSAVADAMDASGHRLELIGPADLQGIGATPVYRVARAGPTSFPPAGEPPPVAPPSD
jgi:adenylate cyclase